MPDFCVAKEELKLLDFIASQGSDNFVVQNLITLGQSHKAWVSRWIQTHRGDTLCALNLQFGSIAEISRSTWALFIFRETMDKPHGAETCEECVGDTWNAEDLATRQCICLLYSAHMPII